jgi:hypothetical protein
MSGAKYINVSALGPEPSIDRPAADESRERDNADAAATSSWARRLSPVRLVEADAVSRRNASAARRTARCDLHRSCGALRPIAADSFTAEAARHGDSWCDHRRLHSMLSAPKSQLLTL